MFPNPSERAQRHAGGTPEVLPSLAWAEVPKMSTIQARHMTTLATGRYGFELQTLMERAGQSLAGLATHLAPDGPVLVVAGRGHNGGVGLAAAHCLARAHRSVWVVPTHEAENYSGVPKELLERLAELPNVRVRSSLPKMKFSCALDTAVGMRLEGPPRGRTLDVITVLNNLGCKVLSLDVPTGLAADSGEVPGDVVRASATLALALPKPGTPPGGVVGDLYLANLDLPEALFYDVGLEPFAPPAPWARVV
jgi:NAD(P)H-hydrate epimerase